MVAEDLEEGFFPITQLVDSTKVKQYKPVERDFTQNPKEKYTGSDFEYRENYNQISNFERFTRWLKRQLSFPKISNKYGEWVIYTVYFICGVIVLLAFYIIGKFIAKNKGRLLFAKEAKNIEIPHEEIIEDIHEIDFTQIIAQHELQANYRAALRYQFLKLLKSYADAGKIQWTQEKTNADYLHELQNPDEKKHFQRAVYIFEHVWYGDFEINEATYRALSQEIQLKTSAL